MLNWEGIAVGRRPRDATGLRVVVAGFHYQYQLTARCIDDLIRRDRGVEDPENLPPSPSHEDTVSDDEFAAGASQNAEYLAVAHDEFARAPSNPAFCHVDAWEVGKAPPGLLDLAILALELFRQCGFGIQRIEDALARPRRTTNALHSQRAAVDLDLGQTPSCRHVTYAVKGKLVAQYAGFPPEVRYLETQESPIGDRNCNTSCIGHVAN